MRTSRYVMVALLLTGYCLPPVTRAAERDESQGSPYEAIVGRNVFGLKPPPPPVDPTANVKVEPPKVKLQGITTILGRRQVLMKVMVPAKPPAPAKEEGFVLNEGDRQGEIEILSIDELSGTVKINNNGTPLTLTMENDAEKAPTGGPGIAPPLSGASTTPKMGAVIPPGVMPNNNGVGGVPGTFGGPGGVPARPLRGGTGDVGFGGVPTGGTALPQSDLSTIPQRSTEASVLLYEANRAKNEELRKAGAKLPKMPPHRLLQGDPAFDQPPN